MVGGYWGDAREYKGQRETVWNTVSTSGTIGNNRNKTWGNKTKEENRIIRKGQRNKQQTGAKRMESKSAKRKIIWVHPFFCVSLRRIRMPECPCTRKYRHIGYKLIGI